MKTQKILNNDSWLDGIILPFCLAYQDDDGHDDDETLLRCRRTTRHVIVDDAVASHHSHYCSGPLECLWLLEGMVRRVLIQTYRRHVPVVVVPWDADDEPSILYVAPRHSPRRSRRRRQSTSNAETKSIRQTHCQDATWDNR